MILIFNTGLQNAWVTVSVHPERFSFSPLASSSTCMLIIHQMYISILFLFPKPQTCVSSGLLGVSTWQLNQASQILYILWLNFNYLPHTCTSWGSPSPLLAQPTLQIFKSNLRWHPWFNLFPYRYIQSIKNSVDSMSRRYLKFIYFCSPPLATSYTKMSLSFTWMTTVA